MSKIPRLDACNCFAARQASRVVTQLYERHLGAAGITSAQFTILYQVDRNPGVTMSELAEALVMDRTTLVRALKPLQRDGLLTSEPGDKATRTLRLSLSGTGSRKLAEALPRWQEAQREFEQRVGRKRAATLRHDLLEIAGRV